MTGHGLPWSRTTVAKVENRSRSVTVDELLGLAYVLGVPPATLVTWTDSTANVSVTPTVTVPTAHVWNWMTGIGLPIGGERPNDPTEFDDGKVGPRWRRATEALPDHIIVTEHRLPGVRGLTELVAELPKRGGPSVRDDVEAYRLLSELLSWIENDVSELRIRAELEISRAPMSDSATEPASEIIAMKKTR